ncbi:amidase domain-containing protein [Geosporobacter ferrireducens]|uniref:Putative amidase domain-containing protein n=1 Tax=Geosporobacter ferrireducens TaxID=1424294 RepID=A0A1D8GJ52_9FIRM|nr:amidase domain-containing protein [Geosporobacter ferrireducens]AOT70941.1 hypothetical protein Gferi_16045 [Geosporobacter ferrireducens]MTI53652.1 hypothetical protein [Geosporobacter ferrireducens]
MKKIHIRFMLMCLCIVMVFASSYSVFGENANNSDDDRTLIQATIQKYFDSYYKTLKTGTYVDVADLFTDNDEAMIPQRILKNHLLLFKEFGRSYNFYELALDFKDIKTDKNTAKVKMIENAQFQYNVSPKDIISEIGNVEYIIELEKIDDTWKISSIDSETNLNYEYVKNELKLFNTLNSKQTKKQYIANMFDKKDNYTKSLKNSLKKSFGADTAAEAIVDTDTTSDLTIQATYSYDIDKGIRYARAFAKESSLEDSKKIFAAASPDCTNFVSQCIWAAYGGWDESSVTNSRNNVGNKVRMTTSWYGAKFGYGDISNAFAGVTYLYNYVTSSKTTGPKGTGYGEASTSSFNLNNVGRGDVVQFYSNSYGNWRHSVYVSYAYKTLTENIIFVCAHSGEALDEDILTYLNNPDKTKARGIRFSSANF